MENATRPHLPADVVDRAVCLIAQQETTPESPGSKIPDGRVTLCAGAALAVAGLEIQGDFDRAEELREGIVSSGSKDGIRRVFVEQGWSSGLCDRIMRGGHGIAVTVSRLPTGEGAPPRTRRGCGRPC